MLKAVAILYPEGANVRIPFEVEFHSGFDEGDVNDVVRQLFPHIDTYDAFGEILEET